MTGVPAPGDRGVVPEGWVPEFEGQRPPLGVGHTLTMRHGAWSPRSLDPVAEKFLESVLTDDGVPYLRERRYRPALVAWSKAEARVALIEAWVEGMSIAEAAESRDGRTSPLELLRKWEASASTHRERLGLTPVSAARLGRDVAQTHALDTAQVMAELHRRDAGGGSS